jgi:hypothetical protein
MSARRALRQRGLLLIFALYAVLITIPQPPGPVGRGLDASWILGLNMAHAQHLVHGKDIVFAYGPLGYLAHPEPASGEPGAVLAYDLGLYLIWAVAIFRIAIVFRSRTTALWTIAILAMVVTLDVVSREAQPLLTVIAALLLPLAARSRWRYLELAVAAFLVAVATMIKLNDGIEAVAVFLPVAAVVMYRDWPLTREMRRQALSAIAVLPVSMVTLYFLSTGSIAGIWPYFRMGWEVTSGYSGAMGIHGASSQVLVDLVLVGLFLGIPLIGADFDTLSTGYLPAALVAFFEFKHAIVRQDFLHAAPFYPRLAVAMLFLLVCAGKARAGRIIALLQYFTLLLAYVVITTNLPGSQIDIESRLLIRPPYTSAVASYWHWRAVWKNIGEVNARERAKIRRDSRFEETVGRHTVSVVPWNIDRAKAENWNWKPSPVLQFYSAYTPLLDQTNAARIDSEPSADFAVADLSDIDGRHPFLCEPRSWLALFDRYDLEAENEETVLLRRRHAPRFGTAVAVGSQVIRWDQEITVPQVNGFLLLAPQLRKTLRGGFRSIAFRASPVYLDTRYSSGKTARWRTVPLNMAAGVLIDPFPQSEEDFGSAFLPDSWRVPHDRIVALRFHTERPSEYAAAFRVVWSRLPASPPE